MRPLFKTIALLSAVAIGAFTVQTAIAGPGQYGMGKGGCPMMMGGNQQAMKVGFGPGMRQSMRNVVVYDAAWIEKTKTELGITAAQAGAWDKYVIALKDQSEMMQSFRDNKDPATMRNMPTQDRLALRDSHRETRLQLSNEIDTARAALVAELSEEQKTKATQLLQPNRFSKKGNRPCRR